MVECRAIRNFISVKEATQLGLTLSGEDSHIKDNNLATFTLIGVTQGTQLRLRAWERQVDFMILPIDDFDVVLEIGFLTKAHA
ncbi:unnamed protein product [Spirodela intermedia]|uniref:Uncharacterized protein n=1 Tax=Spirodela intermedia TaxID=51605 RepID=A0A7I8K8H6_SPIIN|nr:unnamed protein product [Spirodela intermedia]